MGDITVKDELELKKAKPLMIFGKDVREIKCFRNSFIFGICGGIAGGLLSFMSTSKALFSTHVGFGTFWFGVLLYWFPCRYFYESKTLQVDYYKTAISKMKKEKSVQSESKDQ